MTLCGQRQTEPASDEILPASITRPATVLGICASAKPPLGSTMRSAVRGYLLHALRPLARSSPPVQLLDLRESPLPWFDGRRPEAVDDPNVALAVHAVRSAGALLLGLPGYWSAIGGVFKNFCEVLAGPAYDLAGEPTVFAGKRVGLLVVGADAPSTSAAARQASVIMGSLGARLVAPPVEVFNPREIRSEEQLEALERALLGLAAATLVASRRVETA